MLVLTPTALSAAANAELLRVVAAADALGELLFAYSESHPRGLCDCPLCGQDTGLARVADAMAYQAGACAAAFECWALPGRG